jgi:hypothetical protein
MPSARVPIGDAVHLDGDRTEARRGWMPKMDFPRFDGTDPRIWIDKCIAYFALYQIPLAFKVPAASIHMSGSATHWFQTYKQSPGFQQWEHFVQSVVSEFAIDTHRSKTMELLNLKQTGTVEDYRHAFDYLVYHIKLYDSSLSNTMLTTQFIMGHKEDLRFPVEMQLPDTVARAAMLASVHEKLLDKYQKK